MEFLNQNLNEYEKEEGFVFVRWVEAKDAINTNLNNDHSGCSGTNIHIMERKVKVLLIQEIF